MIPKNLSEHYYSGENLYTRVVSPCCEKHGLSYMEFTVLMFLANNPQFDTASQIVKHRNLTKSYVSVSIRNLEEKGLLLKEYRDSNHRSIHLLLTEKSAPIVEDGRKFQKNFREILFEGFSEEDIVTFMKFIERIDNNINNCKIKSNSKRKS